MKANELMIGDWVSVCGEPKQVKDLDIRRVGIVFSKLIHAVDEKMIAPICLTKEILEKNGFGDSFATNEKICKCEDFEIWIDFKNQGYWACIKNEVGDLYFEGNKMYVHELQHALRLCGIDKEIVL